jgi:hypothetical protein
MGAEPRFVEAKIKFVKPGERAIFYPTDRSKSYMPFDDYDVRIGDVRPIAGELSMAKNGFVLLTRPTAVKDFYDPAEIKQVYYPEIAALVKALTGAEKVLTFGEMVRSDNPAVADGNLPSFGAHVDYGARSVRDFTVQQLGPEDAERWLKRRHMLINLWRPIRTVQRTPLALVDASTVAPGDLNESEIRGGLGDPNRPPLFGFNLAFNPAQRWWYAPQMRHDEILAFKLFDTKADEIQWTGHSAFTDPTSPPDAPPRESIEIRTISFMPE